MQDCGLKLDAFQSWILTTSCRCNTTHMSRELLAAFSHLHFGIMHTNGTLPCLFSQGVQRDPWNQGPWRVHSTILLQVIDAVDVCIHRWGALCAVCRCCYFCTIIHIKFICKLWFHRLGARSMPKSYVLIGTLL